MWFVLAALGLILNIAYDYSPDGLAEENIKKQNRSRKHDFDESDGADEEADENLFEEEDTTLRRTARRRNQSEDEDMKPEDFDVIDENGLPDLEEQLQGEGRKVLQELRRRGRRSNV